ncbi:MAG: beta-phosphoglucomutase family hydrolase [Reinekea sp.]|jgi:beta-phosphoglucomutase family hydrolase
MMLTPELQQRLAQADALIFDMDGTLVDTMPLHYIAWQQVAEHYRLPFSRPRFYQLGGVPTFETLQILSSEAGLEIDIAAAKAMKENLSRTLMSEATPIAETLAIVQQFYGNKPLAIATGSSRAGAEMLLGQLQLAHYFDALVTADDVAHHKPAPDVFLAAALHLNVAPERCVAFEDTDIGIQAILSAGMSAVDVRDLIK